MEYCEGGDLAQFLKKLRKQKSEFPEEVNTKSCLFKFKIGYMENIIANNIGII